MTMKVIYYSTAQEKRFCGTQNISIDATVGKLKELVKEKFHRVHEQLSATFYDTNGQRTVVSLTDDSSKLEPYFSQDMDAILINLQ